MTFDQLFVAKKIKDIDGYAQEVKKDVLGFSDKEILGDSGRIHIAERLVQLIVDAMIDINQHIIKEKNLDVIDDFQGTFKVLADNNILPEEFALKIAPVVGIRNRIVHGYEKLDKNLFITNLRKNYSDFGKYASYISEHIK